METASVTKARARLRHPAQAPRTLSLLPPLPGSSRGHRGGGADVRCLNPANHPQAIRQTALEREVGLRVHQPSRAPERFVDPLERRDVRRKLGGFLLAPGASELVQTVVPGAARSLGGLKPRWTLRRRGPRALTRSPRCGVSRKKPAKRRQAAAIRQRQAAKRRRRETKRGRGRGASPGSLAPWPADGAFKIKMSEVLLDFAEPLLEEADGREATAGVIHLAVLAWNDPSCRTSTGGGRWRDSGPRAAPRTRR